MSEVELLNVSKLYGNKQPYIIKNLDVNIESGEFFVIVGPSGCGKSTLLRMIAGLENISEGVLRIGGEMANHWSPSQRDISMVFQNYALYPHLNVRENIVFGLRVKKVSPEEREKRLLEACEMLNLTAYLNRKPRELSGGQRQRVALARAIVSQSPICLMDEPLSNLDAKLRAHMRGEIRKIQRQFGTTMIYVTHDQVEAMTMGDRMMILNQGKIQQMGRPIDIYNHPANTFVASFIGSPQMNMCEAYYDGNSQEIRINKDLKLTMTLPKLKTSTYIIGLRPEYIHIPQPNNPNQTIVQVEINHVELLGNDTLFSFQINDQQWIAKWNGQWLFEPGDKISIALDADELCVFDKDTRQLVHSSTRQDHDELQKGVLA
ncbi:ABC transporter ATP-binding protein [Terrilactibacillus laevilacticus]|uniref:ABC transporter ATP-binding protein n=1 Tax=Terrilactibacillus laevilacticus TaxID=1380157 RepID=UPI0011470F2A|nr:ABC transporter ATP-binding protein [Terrilactibacillus laevilacticus]